MSRVVLNLFSSWEVGEIFRFAVLDYRARPKLTILSKKREEKTHKTESKLHERLIKRILFGGSAESCLEKKK